MMNSKGIMAWAIGAYALLCSTAGVAQQKPEEVKADINIEKQEGMWKIQGVFLNNDEVRDSLRYSLKVERVGKSGKSSNNQGGFFEARKDEKVVLSTVSINVAEGDTYNLDLVIYDREDEIICEKKLSNKN